jgi:hypothetical protein
MSTDLPNPPEEPRAPEPTAAAPPEAPPAAAPSVIHLRVATTPPGAQVSLDGKSLGKTPIDREVAAAQKPGQLKIQLRGHRALVRKVDLGADVVLELALQREGKGPSRPHGTPDKPPGGLDIKEGR